MQPNRLGLERLHRVPRHGAELAAKATEERKGENFLAKTSMTCLPVTGFDKSTHKPKWVECKDNKRLEVKGFRRHGPRGTARMAISLKRRLRRRLQGFTTTCNPLARVGTVSRLISDGIGFVKVSEA
jgi:hypothetical protein